VVSAPSAAVPLFAVYDPKDLRLPARNIDSEWHVVANQSEPRHCFYSEEVHVDHYAEVCFDECRPGHSFFPLWRRVDAILLEDTLDRVSSDLVAKVLQGTLDPRVSPGVLSRHPNNQCRDLGRGRATGRRDDGDCPQRPGCIGKHPGRDIELAAHGARNLSFFHRGRLGPKGAIPAQFFDINRAKSVVLEKGLP